MAAIVERLESDHRRAIPYFRVRELTPPLSRSYVFQLLRDGQLRAVRLNGILLIEQASLEEWLASGQVWTPRDDHDRGAA